MTTLLESAEVRKMAADRYYFMINLHESMGPGRDQTQTGIELATPEPAVRQVTDCATELGISDVVLQKQVH